MDAAFERAGKPLLLIGGKRGAIPAHVVGQVSNLSYLAPILERLKIAQDDWLLVVGNFGRLLDRVAGGLTSVSRQRTRFGRRFRAGGARLLGAAQSPT